MKALHRPDLFSYSVFDPARNIDFHSVLLVSGGGNVLVDPLPLSAHDAAHVSELGGLAKIVVTNAEHVRDAAAIAARFGAPVFGPAAQRDDFPIACAGWLDEGDAVTPALLVLALHGSKTPGELALVLDGTTLITGDLVRSHKGGELTMLPDAKLADREAAIASVRRLAALAGIEAVLVGDGWPVFRDGHRLLDELASRLA